TSGFDTGLVPQAWSPDGTQLLVYTNRTGSNQIALTNVDPFPARLVMDDPTAELFHPNWSADGKQLLYEARLPDKSLEPPVTNVDTRRTRKLFSTVPEFPASHAMAAAWAPAK